MAELNARGREVWKMQTPGTLWVETTVDPAKGTTKQTKTSGKGTLLRISTEDRQLTQERVQDKKHDPFVNGTLIRVDEDQQADPDTASLSAKSDEDLLKLLSVKTAAKFQSSIDVLSEVSLRRLKDLMGDGENATVNQITWVGQTVDNKFGVNRGKNRDLTTASAEEIANTFPVMKLS